MPLESGSFVGCSSVAVLLGLAVGLVVGSVVGSVVGLVVALVMVVVGSVSSDSWCSHVNRHEKRLQKE